LTTTEGAEFAEEVNLFFRVFRVFRSFFVFLGSGQWPGCGIQCSVFRKSALLHQENLVLLPYACWIEKRMCRPHYLMA